MQYKLNVNDSVKTVEVDEDTPLLWVLRDNLRLTGTKFGCGIAACGACTVHINGVATRSCVMPVAAVADSKDNYLRKPLSREPAPDIANLAGPGMHRSMVIVNQAYSWRQPPCDRLMQDPVIQRSIRQ